METAEKLITKNLDVWTSAVKAKPSAGRCSSNKRELYGIQKVRELILELAFSGGFSHSDTNRSEWKELTVEEIASELLPGFACGKSNQMPGGHVHLRTHNISTSGSLNFDLLVEIDPAKVDEKKASIDKGDILFNNTNSQELVGKTSLVDKDYPYGFSNHLTRIRLKESVFPPFFVYYFKLLRDSGHFAKLCTRWINQAGINTKILKRETIPVPPLAEQHRIVAKVDELMALCDQLEQEQTSSLEAHDTLVATLLDALTNTTASAEGFADAWQRIQANFDTLFTTESSIDALKQTILQLAVMGKLVPQDLEDENATDLLKRIVSERERLIKEKKIKRQKAPAPITQDEEPYTVPDKWKWCRLGDVSLSSDSGWSPQCDPQARDNEEQWGVLKVSAVSWGAFRPDEHKMLPAGEKARPECEVKSGDFLLSRANTEELVARGVIVVQTPPKLMMSDKIVRFLVSEQTSKEFVNLVNASSSSREHYISNSSGTSSSMKNVSRATMSNLPIPLPPLAEQHRIVAKVDELMAICDQLKANLATAQATQLNLADSLVEQAIE